jgi:hypothetical protein
LSLPPLAGSAILSARSVNNVLKTGTEYRGAMNITLRDIDRGPGCENIAILPQLRDQ